MHLRTSIILALSALSLGACISNPSSAPTSSSSSTPINPFAKDYIYYFEHLDEAKAKNEQCLKDGVFKKVGVDMENADERQMIAEYPDDILMLNPGNNELSPCFAAWTANNAAEPLRKWQEENKKKEELNQKFEKQVIRLKTEWEKKYANEDWNTFYPEALRKESVQTRNRKNRLEDRAKREAIDRIFVDKAEPFLNELKTKNIETLTKEIPQSCRKGAWDLIPSCKAYYYVLKDKFSEKTLSELAGMEKQYKGAKHLSAPVLSAAYRSAVEGNSEKMDKALMLDYRKRNTEYMQCAKKIGDKIAATPFQMDKTGDYTFAFYSELYPECVITNQVMERLDLPTNLSKVVDREVSIKLSKQIWEKADKVDIEREQLEKSPEVAQIKTILAQKYAQTPWQNFISASEKDYPSTANIFSGTEEEQNQKQKQYWIKVIALEQVLTDKMQPFVDELAKNSIDKLIAELPASCRDEGKIDWLADSQCDAYFRALKKKFQNQTLEEHSASKDKYENKDEEGFLLVYRAYFLAWYEQERKQYLELSKDDTKREAAYRQCLKNISGIIEKSYISEEDNDSSYARRAPGCLAFSSGLPVESSRFKYFTETLLNKKRFQQASAVKQN
jgi:hypothetical protein